MEDVFSENIKLSSVKIEDELFFKISYSDEMRPFFMSIVSDSNHWMFISSNGGLSAGRSNAESSLFPYYTDDKITESAEVTGSKSIFVVRSADEIHVWEPFSNRGEGKYNVRRNLYKNTYGNKVLFEEINYDLQLTFQYQWNSSDKFGFVRKSKLINNGQSETIVSVLDGIQNIVPYGVGSELQNQTSNLVDAYKRNELEKKSGLGIYALSAIIVDKAEPSEALKASIVWSIGQKKSKRLLSSLQVGDFRKGNPISQEEDIKAEKGAYFIQDEFQIDSKSEEEWMIIADVNQNHASIALLMKAIEINDDLEKIVLEDIELGTASLIKLNSAADGLQLTADKYRDSRHFANTLFNIMRGGVFDYNYQIERNDFLNYLSKANMEVYTQTLEIIKQLPDVFNLNTLKKLAHQSNDKDFQRLCLEYMPLKFSRRHGDPSRPWNKFSINTKSVIDGSKILDYEGNWRDIFQNWEALAHSFPNFIESMIHKFLNATTFDGYNPYRVTKGGFDWETIEPDNPWSYIGYWGDHQIIYLLKFLEHINNVSPKKLDTYFEDEIFVYADVPYRIKRYEEILKNSKETIDFDVQSDKETRDRKAKIGADGALILSQKKSIHRANFIEKIVAILLAKMSNFIPEGGIWMNTQRPEWNDANNALVGNGVSMVTLYYLRRFLTFFRTQLSQTTHTQSELSSELFDYFDRVNSTLEKHQDLLGDRISDIDRKHILDGLSNPASDYRELIYEQSFSGHKKSLSIKRLLEFVDLSLKYLNHSIAANVRQDNLFHAYNLMTVVDDNSISITHLDEMLEGQVAVLSSGYLTTEQSLCLLDSLKKSKLFREDQYSYILYPNKELPGFLSRNTIPKEAVNKSGLLMLLLKERNIEIIEKDVNGEYHFNGNIKNAKDLKVALEDLPQDKFGGKLNAESKDVLQIFENVFNHKAFTGRSGTFYGYEGLGSIYWHMVSKLQLVVQECCVKAIKAEEPEGHIGRLLEHYYEINEGIGVHKPPSLYGAFPTDPYSHTPGGKGAQQPGMTGQVKEDILSRFGELGVFVGAGKLFFNPHLLKKVEFLTKASSFDYIDVHLEPQQIELKGGSLCFTYCQIPVVYTFGEENSLEVLEKGNVMHTSQALYLDTIMSNNIFSRNGSYTRINVRIKEEDLL